MKLQVSAQITALLKEKLLEAFPNLIEDEAALYDTLEGMTDFNELVQHIISSALDDEAMVGAIGNRIADLQARAERLNERIANKRRVVGAAMEMAGVRKIEGVEATISLRAVPPKLVIVNEDEIPGTFWKEKIVKSIDKEALKEALKTEIIPGAQMGNGSTTLAIRTK